MPSPTSADAPPPMYSPSQMRLLRIAVVVMGVILLLGFLTVIGRIVWLVNSAPPRQPDPKSVAAQALTSPAEAARPAAPHPMARNLPPVKLPLGASVRSISLAGDRLAVHFEGPQGAGLTIVDLSGREPAVTIPVASEGPPAK